MPELPEVEHLRRTLEPHLLGKTITEVTLRTPSIINHRNGKRNPPTPRKTVNHKYKKSLLFDSTITTIKRHGKKLAIIANTNQALSISLGMTGQLYYIPPHQRLPDLKHIHLIWKLAVTTDPNQNTGCLVYRDPRRFGSIDPFPSFKDLTNTLWRQLGPDALTITTQALAEALKHSRAPIKAALLNQKLLAGIGNIYADEVLFQTQIHPRTPANTLRQPQIKQLSSAIRNILRKSIKFGGTTYSDYVDADHQPGQNARNLKIYGRKGRNCTRCNQPVTTTKITGRTTTYCPNCQKYPDTTE